MVHELYRKECNSGITDRDTCTTFSNIQENQRCRGGKSERAIPRDLHPFLRNQNMSLGKSPFDAALLIVTNVDVRGSGIGDLSWIESWRSKG
eukprot:431836-Amorphochlora_amoeboformis.AAC.2